MNKTKLIKRLQNIQDHLTDTVSFFKSDVTASELRLFKLQEATLKEAIAQIKRKEVK